ASEWLGAAQVDSAESLSFLTKSLPSDPPETVDLKDLERFFRNPAKYFFNQRLKVYFETDQSGSDEYEPFSVDKLSEYLLKDRYLQTALAGGDLDTLDHQVIAEGIMPLGYAGARQLASIRHESTVLAEKLSVLCDGQQNRREVDVALDKVHLVGWQRNWFDNRLVLARPAQINGRDRIILWINHLAACATLSSAPVEKSWYRGLSGQCGFIPLSPQDAKAELNQLIDVFLDGQTRPLAFHPEIAWAFQKQCDDDEDKAREKAEALFVGGYKQRSVGSDPYIARVYPHYQSFSAEVEALAAQLLTKPLALIEESGDE
ncbi:MAG: hypothetical protein ACPGPF_10745, partial [Pontibacterium sp.]